MKKSTALDPRICKHSFTCVQKILNVTRTSKASLASPVASKAKKRYPKSSRAAQPKKSVQGCVDQNDVRFYIRNYVDASKDDHKVKYYFTHPPNPNQQADRDWVARAVSYYNARTKDPCPRAGTVTAALPLFVQGYLQDLDSATAPAVTFKTAKHFGGLVAYLAETRGEYHNITVRVSIDDSPYFAAMPSRRSEGDVFVHRKFYLQIACLENTKIVSTGNP